MRLRLKMLNVFVLFATLLDLSAQDPMRFKKQIEAYKTIDEALDYQDVIVFTGSSSILFWKTLKVDFPNYNVINRGFGGSQFSDLIYFADQLILQYLPGKIFIYEGDNDIAYPKPVDSIFLDAKYLVSKIRRTLPNAEIHFIAPKPSVARWHLKDQYLTLIHEMKKWCSVDKKLHFVDVWAPMCDENGEVEAELFIGDKLHMNEKGYEIWKQVIRTYLD